MTRRKDQKKYDYLAFLVYDDLIHNHLIAIINSITVFPFTAGLDEITFFAKIFLLNKIHFAAASFAFK